VVAADTTRTVVLLLDGHTGLGQRRYPNVSLISRDSSLHAH
jgi:hypothetical protein